MAIIIENDPYPIYRGAGIINEERMKFAENLDKNIKNSIKELENTLKLMKSKNAAKLEIYHKMGSKILEIGKDVPDYDKKWLPYAFSLHAPSGSELNKRFRGKVHDHFYYCIIIAKYDLEKIIKKWTWGQWVHLCQSKSLINDQRIFKWIEKKFDVLKDFGEGKKREKNTTRDFFPYLNLHVSTKGRDFSLFNDKEYYELYDEALSNYLKE